MFTGRDLDAHTVCKSEAEKYFGKFYQPKSSTQASNKEQSKAPNKEISYESEKNSKVSEKIQSLEENSKRLKNEKDENNEVEKWKGWKNEIKKVLVECKEGVQVKDLKRKVVRRFKKCFGDRLGVDDIFEKKVQFHRFVKRGDSVFYYRCLNGEV
jgi:ABC-type ATPase with predicted acetyltransferase domain